MNRNIYVIIILIVAALSLYYIVPTLISDKTGELEKSEENSPNNKIVLKQSTGSLTILYDNYPYNLALKTSWGFSCLIEVDDTTILFDTGGDGKILLDNMRKLGVDADKIEYIVLSHVHNDHIGGLLPFLDINNNVTVIIPNSFPYHVKSDLRVRSVDIVEVKNATNVCEYAATTGVLGTDIDEQSLMVSTSKGLIIVTGCSHPGVVNIVEKAVNLTNKEVYLVIGGFHLGSKSEVEINKIISDLRNLGVNKIAPTHCTGDKARKLFEEAFGENYLESGVGFNLGF